MINRIINARVKRARVVKVFYIMFAYVYYLQGMEDE